LIFPHIHQFSIFADHQGILVHVFEGLFENLPQIGWPTAMVFYKIIGAVFGLEGPFGPYRHHPHDVSTDDPVGLVGIDLLFRVEVPDGYFVDGFIRVQRHVDGGAVYRAYVLPAAVCMRDNHPGMLEFRPVHTAVKAGLRFGVRDSGPNAGTQKQA